MPTSKKPAILLLLGFLAPAVLCQRTPTISYLSQQQIKDIGGTVDLICTVQYSSEYPVLWVKKNPEKNDRLPISSNSVLIIPDSRFHIKSDPETSTYTLRINDIQETDSGFYECEILITTNFKVSGEVELLIRRPAFISDNSTRSILVPEGVPVMMECYAGGFPAPRITWRRQNNGVLPNGRSIFRGNELKLPAVSKDDRGTYYCIAENGVGRGARRNINLEIEFKPVISAPRPRLGQALQYDMDLACHVEAFPPPAISWYFNGQLLTNSQHYSVSHFATADEYTDTILRVITVEKRQFGNYTCKAANKLGFSEAIVELFETIIPSCPPACNT